MPSADDEDDDDDVKCKNSTHFTTFHNNFSMALQ